MKKQYIIIIVIIILLFGLSKMETKTEKKTYEKKRGTTEIVSTKASYVNFDPNLNQNQRNYGSCEWMHIVESGTYDSRGYVYFDTSGYSGKTVTSAKVSLNLQWQSSNDMVTVKLYTINSNWDEGAGTCATPTTSGIMGSNAPPLGTYIGYTTQERVVGSYSDIEVVSGELPKIQDMIDNPSTSKSFAIVINTNPIYAAKRFYSDDGTYPPKLILTFQDTPTCNTVADTNCDGVVSKSELQGAGNLWVSGSITREQLSASVAVWANS